MDRPCSSSPALPMGRQAKAARSSQQRVGLSMSTKEALFRDGGGAGAGAPGGVYTDHYGSDYGGRLGRSLSDAAARADAGISDLRIFAAAAVDASTCAAEKGRGGGNGAAEASLRGMTAAMMAGGFQPRGAAPPAVPPAGSRGRGQGLSEAQWAPPPGQLFTAPVRAGDADQSSLLALREAILQGENEREAARGGGRASRVGRDVENGAGTDGTAFTPLSTQQAQGQWQLQSQQKQQQREQQPGVGRLGKGEDEKRQQPHADKEEVYDDDASTSTYEPGRGRGAAGGIRGLWWIPGGGYPPQPRIKGFPTRAIEEDCAVCTPPARRAGTRPAVGNVAEGTAGGPSAADGDAADGNLVEGDAEGVGAEAGDALGWGGGVLAAALPSLSLDLVDGSAFSLDEIEVHARGSCRP
eukprot:jgi/Mesvir1/18048/Mv09365-RA.1